MMNFDVPAEKSGPRLLMRREQPRHDVKENRHRKEQGQSNQAKPGDRRVDTRVIGDAGGAEPMMPA
jgi:hypothetical protein